MASPTSERIIGCGETWMGRRSRRAGRRASPCARSGGGEDERPTFDALEEGFADVPDYTRQVFEEWAAGEVRRAEFDPLLCFLALDGDEIAGVAYCTSHRGGGWVNDLAVRRPWRRRGLALALLHHAFGEFRRRGCASVGLNVNAANPTGALELYRRAGMRVARELAQYQKELRPQG
jgi:ribosomal protein S18 acetylase RimI-like enzyme